MIKIKKGNINVGNWVRVYFTDTGVSDGVVTEVNKTSINIYFPCQGTRSIDKEQVIVIGPYLEVPIF